MFFPLIGGEINLGFCSVSKHAMPTGMHGLQCLCPIEQMVKLKAFDKFENTTDALNAASHLVDSKLPKGLRKFLKAQCQGETLVIADSKLGKAISDKLVGLILETNTFFVDTDLHSLPSMHM